MSLLLATVGGGGPVNYTLTCAAGSYTYTGQVATLKRGYTLTCGTGAYVYAGQAATLKVAHSLVCAAGSYTYTGQAATLKYARSLTCSAGAYTYAGQAAALKVARSLALNTGTYSYTGNAAILTYTPGAGAVNYTLTCVAGAYSYSGVAAALIRGYSLSCAVGSYDYVGNAAALTYVSGVLPIVPEVTVPAGMTFTPIRVGQVQVVAKKLTILHGRISASGETGSQAAVAHVLPTRRVQVRYGVTKTEAGASARVCGRVVQVAKGRAAGSAGGKAVASSSRAGVKVGEIGVGAGGWVKMQSAFLHAAGGPGSAEGVRNLTDIEVLMLHHQMRRARIVAQNKKT